MSMAISSRWRSISDSVHIIKQKKIVFEVRSGNNATIHTEIPRPSKFNPGPLKLCACLTHCET